MEPLAIFEESHQQQEREQDGVISGSEYNF